MVRQQLDLLQIIRVQKAAGCGAEILLRIVDAGDDRNADAERPAAFLEPFEVFQNRLIGHACIVPVLLRVHQLQIHHDILDPRQHGFKYAPAAIAARFDCAVHPRDAVQRFQQELRLPRRFTAGKRHAARHCGKIVLVAQELPGQLLRRIALPAELAQALRAGADTLAAGCAAFPAVRAGFDAGPAVQAVV